MDQQPQMRWDEATGSVVELAPVVVSRESYQAELDAAQIDLNNSDGEVRGLEEHKVTLETELKTTTENLDGALVRQEDARLKVAFQEARVSAYDEVVRLRGNVVDAGQSNENVPADSNVEPEGTVAGQPTPEDVAETLELLADESSDTEEDDEEAVESEEVIVPTRIRAKI